MFPLARVAGVAIAALLAVGLAWVALGPGGVGSKPTPTPPTPIAPGSYAVDLPVSKILTKLDASTLSDSDKQAVIDSILVVRGATTLNLRLTVTADQFTLRQGTDGGRLEPNPSWHITKNDGLSIAFDRIPAGSATAEYRVVRGADPRGFTLRAMTPADSLVETVVREILFDSTPYLPAQ